MVIGYTLYDNRLTPAASSDTTSGVRVVTCLLLTLALVAATPSGIRGSGDPPVRHLDRATFEDKVRGGWAGQMVGVSFGAPTEFHSNGKIIEGDLPAVGARPRLQRHRPGRPLRRDDVCRGHGSRRPARDDGAIWRGVQDVEVRAVARQRGRAPAAEPRHPRAALGRSALQPARQRHRLPDRVRLHRPDDAGAAACCPGFLSARRPRDELGRRPVRRHLHHEHVCGRLLRHRSAARRRGRPRGAAAEEQLRGGDPRRARVARRAPGRLEVRVADARREVGQERRVS